MRILGVEIRRAPPPEPQLTPRERMFAAIDDLNYAWGALQCEEGRRSPRPWVIWDEQRVVATEYNGRPVVVHETEGVE